MASVVSLWADWPGTSGEQWSTIIDQGRKEKKKGKCYHGNGDIVLNIPVTVIEECVWEWAAPICVFVCDSELRLDKKMFEDN